MRVLIIYAGLVAAFVLGWLVAALCAVGKIRDLEERLRKIDAEVVAHWDYLNVGRM